MSLDNQINFDILALVPVVACGLFLLYWIKNSVSAIGITTYAYSSVANHTRDLEMILNRNCRDFVVGAGQGTLDNTKLETPSNTTLIATSTGGYPNVVGERGILMPDEDEGMLVFKILTIKKWLDASNVRERTKRMFNEDLSELTSSKMTVSQKLRTVSRMYRTPQYAPFFKGDSYWF